MKKYKIKFYGAHMSPVPFYYIYSTTTICSSTARVVNQAAACLYQLCYHCALLAILIQYRATLSFAIPPVLLTIHKYQIRDIYEKLRGTLHDNDGFQNVQ